MRRATLSCLLLLFCSMPAFAGTATASSGDYELVLTTEANASDRDVITCSAVLTDTKTNQIVAAPRVSFRAGEPATVSSSTDSARFELKLESDGPKNQIVAACRLLLDGELVFAPKVSFELR